MFNRFQHRFCLAPFIDAGEAAALKSSGPLEGELPGEEESLSPEMMASLGIDPKEYEQIIAENPDQGATQSKGNPARKSAKKEMDHNLEAEEIMKKLGGEGEEGEQEEAENSLKEGEEEGEEEEEELPPAAKTKGELRMEDYTRKTQELSRVKKDFEKFQDKSMQDLQDTVAKLDKHYAQFDEKLSHLEIWNQCMDSLKEEQPELYDEVQAAFTQIGRQFKNPVINSQLSKMEKQNAELLARLDRLENGAGKSSSDENIRSEYHKELKETQGRLAHQLKKLGLNVNWEKVQRHWIQTGADTIEQALYGVYGADISKRYQSMDKTNRTRSNVQLLGNPTINRGGKNPGKGKNQAVDISKRSYNDLINDIMGGRISAG